MGEIRGRAGDLDRCLSGDEAEDNGFVDASMDAADTTGNVGPTPPARTGRKKPALTKQSRSTSQDQRGETYDGPPTELTGRRNSDFPSPRKRHPLL